MTKVIWAHRARADLAAIDDYYRAIDDDLARRVVNALLAAIAFLAEHPLAGPQIDQADRRKWRVHGQSYLVFYRAADDGLRILRLLHVAQDRSKAFE